MIGSRRAAGLDDLAGSAALLAAAIALATGCGCGGKGKSESVQPRDGGDSSDSSDAAAAAPPPTTPEGAAAPYLLAPTDPSGALADAGRLQVTVEWSDPPAELLRSPGTADCGDRLPAPVSVHTLHGLRDAVVRIDGIERGRPPPPPAPVELAVRDCRLSPRVQVAPRLGVPLAVINDDERRSEVVLESVVAGAAKPLARLPLPLIGQRYELELAKPGLIRARLGELDSYIVAPPHPYAAVTDDKGRVEFDQVPAGTYTVVAWHPPVDSSATPMEARGEVTVVSGETATVTLAPRPR